MKMRTVCLPPGLTTPGMVLMSSVSGRDGLQLLSAGTTLDTDMRERLVRRGVETVCVEVRDERNEQTIAMELKNAENRLATIFRGPGSPARAALQAAVLNYRREALK